ncbi:MAG: beta-ketoacyl-ACP synthase [Deltaproteobacteria bacterium]|nr:beta-ketoacyl-ACP synthase [Deltaproteobacteria bacterium]
MQRRVVITGIGLASPIGNDLELASAALREGRHGITRVEGWGRIGDLSTRLAGRVCLELEGRWPRQTTRSMGRVAKLAAYASDGAIAQAGLDEALLRSGDVGLAYGSTHGSSEELERFCRRVFAEDSLAGVPAGAYLRFMSHTTTANLAALYGVRGRVISTCAACVSSSQAIGAGYEAIRAGAQDVMICGGAEELHWVPAGVFDILFATSCGFNDAPDDSPRPFDVARDGLVVAEGAATLVLEEYEHAKARGVTPRGEVLGYGTSCDGTHVTSPSVDGMADAMRRALKDARLDASEVDYVNAHATATLVGDRAESQATRQVLGERVPVSSTKAFTGHTLGACGALEAAFCVAMMEQGFLAPSRNLTRVDPECAPLGYILGDAREGSPRRMMTNNFAFGGINTSLILGARP